MNVICTCLSTRGSGFAVCVWGQAHLLYQNGCVIMSVHLYVCVCMHEDRSEWWWGRKVFLHFQYHSRAMGSCNRMCCPFKDQGPPSPIWLLDPVGKGSHFPYKELGGLSWWGLFFVTSPGRGRSRLRGLWVLAAYFSCEYCVTLGVFIWTNKKVPWRKVPKGSGHGSESFMG